MTEVILTRGVPASGKTTWAKEWLLYSQDCTPKRGRVNRDDIRYSVFGKGWGVDEQLVTIIQDFQLNKLVSKGYDVVVDNTNLRARDVKSLAGIAKKHGAQVRFLDFPVDYATAQERDALRQDKGEHYVGFDVVKGFFERFHIDKETGVLPAAPNLDEVGSLEFAPYAPVIGKPHAIIVDIDGTLAHMTNRGPYDTSKYADDAVDIIIRDVVNRAADHQKIIVVSGRDNQFRPVLIEWLKKHGVHYDAIFMRPIGDTRNDAIVKDELFEKHIKDNYYVDYVLDDRDRVVEMWRAKGIKCLQVEPGNF